MRSPIVDAQQVLSRHVVAGGPRGNAVRLDYLVAWLQPGRPIDHRVLTDQIEAAEHTPGARLTNRMSNAIHAALAGSRGRGAGDPQAYDALVRDELDYKTEVLDAVRDALRGFARSTLQDVHRAVEGSAQQVWRRRLELHASDLVRFGRTYRGWRNSMVPMIEDDAKCRDQLLVLANPQAAQNLATDAGIRDVSRTRR